MEVDQFQPNVSRFRFPGSPNTKKNWENLTPEEWLNLKRIVPNVTISIL